MISVEHLFLSYGDKTVLHDFSLTLPSSGVTVLRGPSGCGKTTLLRILAGLETPQKGSIYGISPQNTAVLFQENRLLPWRTVLQQLTDVMPRTRHKESTHWLKFVELEHESHTYPGTLSGGMQRRLALARCLALGGELYLLDEPFAGVDPERAERIFHRLQVLNTPVLLVSHEDTAATLADHVITLDGPPLSLK